MGVYDLNTRAKRAQTRRRPPNGRRDLLRRATPVWGGVLALVVWCVAWNPGVAQPASPPIGSGQPGAPAVNPAPGAPNAAPGAPSAAQQSTPILLAVRVVYTAPGVDRGAMEAKLGKPLPTTFQPILDLFPATPPPTVWRVGPITLESGETADLTADSVDMGGAKFTFNTTISPVVLPNSTSVAVQCNLSYIRESDNRRGGFFATGILTDNAYHLIRVFEEPVTQGTLYLFLQVPKKSESPSTAATPPPAPPPAPTEIPRQTPGKTLQETPVEMPKESPGDVTLNIPKTNVEPTTATATLVATDAVVFRLQPAQSPQIMHAAFPGALTKDASVIRAHLPKVQKMQEIDTKGIVRDGQTYEGGGNSPDCAINTFITPRVLQGGQGMILRFEMDMRRPGDTAPETIVGAVLVEDDYFHLARVADDPFTKGTILIFLKGQVVK